VIALDYTTVNMLPHSTSDCCSSASSGMFRT